jgi:hypothetical protein
MALLQEVTPFAISANITPKTEPTTAYSLKRKGEVMKSAKANPKKVNNRILNSVPCASINSRMYFMTFLPNANYHQKKNRKF